MKIQNLKRFERKLAALPKAAKQQMREAISKSADEIVELQQRLVAVKSGDLKQSITWRWGTEQKVAYSQQLGTVAGGHELSVVISAGNAKVRYAHLVEFGSSEHKAGGKFEGATIPAIPAKPFFYPGYRTGNKRARSRIARAVSKAAKAVASE